MARLVLELLAAIAEISVPLSRELVGRFYLGSNDFFALILPGSPTRSAFIALLVKLLDTGDQAVITSIVVKARKMVISVMRGINGWWNSLSQPLLDTY